MDDFKLLIVEDDLPQIETWKRQIERFNLHNDVVFIADYEDTKEKAIQRVAKNKYDGAIVDIRLKNSNGIKDATTDGNDVRNIILKTELMLVAHITGEPDAVHYDDEKYKDLVKVFTKGDSSEEGKSVHEDVLEWFNSKLDIVSTMHAVKSDITAKMANLFCSSIWPRWNSWNIDGDNSEFVKLCVARHMSSHLYSSYLDGGGGKVHPEEWYFQPPTRICFSTGDVVKISNDYFVLVTPRCDLERIKDDDSLLFARMVIAEDWSNDVKELERKIFDVNEDIENSHDDENRVGKLNKKIVGLKSDFRQKYYGHKKNRFKYHFLPEIKQSKDEVHGPFFVDFSDLKAVKTGSDDAKSMADKKIASVSPEFIPSLVQRLGAFMSRIGSPDYSHIY